MFQGDSTFSLINCDLFMSSGGNVKRQLNNPEAPSVKFQHITQKHQIVTKIQKKPS